MKFVASALVVIMSATAFAQGAPAAAEQTQSLKQRVEEVIEIQRQVDKVQGQVDLAKQQMDSNKSKRLYSIIISGAFLAATGALTHKAFSGGFEDFAWLIPGLATGAVGVSAGANGLYNHYQVTLDRAQVESLGKRLEAIQTKLADKKEKLFSEDSLRK